MLQAWLSVSAVAEVPDWLGLCLAVVSRLPLFKFDGPLLRVFGYDIEAKLIRTPTWVHVVKLESLRLEESGVLQYQI